MSVESQVSHGTEFRWCLDEIRVPEEGRVLVRGWSFAKKRNRVCVPEIAVTDAKGRTVPCAVRRSVREDVTRAQIPDHPELESGFTAEWHYKEDGDFRITFRAGFARAECAVPVAERIREVRETRRKIQNSGGISWCADRVDFPEENRVRVKGWAFARSESGVEIPEIAVTDLEGSAVETSLKRLARPDVNRVYQLDEGRADSSDQGESVSLRTGFELVWTCREEGAYLVRFRAGSASESLFVGIRSERAEKREESRHFIDREAVELYADPDLRKDTAYMQHHWSRTKYEAAMRHRYAPRDPEYTRFIRRTAPSEGELARQRGTDFPKKPLISIAVPTYRTPIGFLKDMIESVRAQTYENWELCLADGSEGDEKLERVLEQYHVADPRVRYRINEKNLGISGNTNEALKIASGDFIALLDHDDVLAPDALYEMVRALNDHPDADFFYSDEDKFEADLRDRCEPAFKADFNWDLFRTNNFICHFTMIRANLVRESGGFRGEYDGAQDFDLFLRCAERARSVVHIPKVLYHWRRHASSTASNPESKPYAVEAGRKAVADHMRRIGRGDVAVRDLEDRMYYYREIYPVSGDPSVDVYLNERGADEAELDACERSIRETCGERTVRIFRGALPENLSDSADYLLFLDGTAQPRTDGWLDLLLGECQREEVGAVGAKTIFRNGTIDQAGMAYGIRGTVGKLLSGDPEETYGPNCRGVLQQEKSVLCGACMMVKKSVLEEVGGPDPELAAAFWDADLSFRIRKSGAILVYEPNVIVSLADPGTGDGAGRSGADTREAADAVGRDAEKEAAREHFTERWKDLLATEDPYYSPNYSLTRTDFSCREDDGGKE